MAAASDLPVIRTGGSGLVAIVDEVKALAPGRQLVDPALVEAAARAWSPNTIRAFLSDIRLWDAWCRRSRVAVGAASADTVAAYVRALSGQGTSEAACATSTRSAATIGRYLVHIGWAYRMAGRDDPTKAPLVRLEHKAARKALGVKQRQARAIRFKGDVIDLDGPASGICLATLLKAVRRDLLGARDEALLRVAYDTGCRRSELVAITVGDIDGPDADGAGTLAIGASKTDRERAGALAYLSPATVRAIGRWRDLAGIDRGALFRRVETYFDGFVRSVGQGPLHANSDHADLQAAGPARVQPQTAGHDERGRGRALGRGGVEPLDPGRGRTRQLCRRGGAARDHAGLSLARSQDRDAVWCQARGEEWGQRAARQAVLRAE